MTLHQKNPFTPREQAIVQFVADGKTAEEIGLILGIERRSVIDHIQHAKEKLGVYKSTALVAASFREGFVS
jgi:LuxR family transcriptional regulator of spore coat protein